jgi:hypothetical protein
LLLTLFSGLWLDRQLKHSRLLSLTEERQEYDLPIRKLQCIVMSDDSVFVDLPKDRRLMVDYFVAPGYQARR